VKKTDVSEYDNKVVFNATNADRDRVWDLTLGIGNDETKDFNQRAGSLGEEDLNLISNLYKLGDRGRIESAFSVADSVLFERYNAANPNSIALPNIPDKLVVGVGGATQAQVEARDAAIEAAEKNS
jgi:hypothetical protein